MTRSTPSWPRLLRRPMAAAYLDMPVAEFERGVASGILPMPVAQPGLGERWDRAKIDVALDRASGLSGDDWEVATIGKAGSI